MSTTYLLAFSALLPITFLVVGRRTPAHSLTYGYFKGSPSGLSSLFLYISIATNFVNATIRDLSNFAFISPLDLEMLWFSRSRIAYLGTRRDKVLLRSTGFRIGSFTAEQSVKFAPRA